MRLYGAIGPRVDGDYFAQELASLDRGDFDMIHIRMNSPGGNVFQGMSIVSAILSMNTPVCVHIDGIAASMAAVVAVAADRVCMMDFAKMMIHDPYFTGESGKATSPKQKKALARLTDMLRQVLVRRGKDEATMAKLMREETWFSAAEALDAGLCDEITSSARNEFMNLDPMQLVAAVDAEYQTNNQEQMEKINLSAEAIVALGSKSGQMDEAAVSAAIVAAVAAKDEEIANLKAAKETAEAEIARLRKEKEDAVAAEAVSFADALVKAGKISADARDAAVASRPTRRTPARSSAAYRNARSSPAWQGRRAATRASMPRSRGTSWTVPDCSPSSKPTTPTSTRRSTRRWPPRCTSAGDSRKRIINKSKQNGITS